MRYNTWQARTSLSGKIAIHEWNESYLVSREWLWCAMTMRRVFNKVSLFQNEKDDEKMFKNFLSFFFNYTSKRKKTKLDIEKWIRKTILMKAGASNILGFCLETRGERWQNDYNVYCAND